MSNVRAEVLRVSRTRSGWRETNQKPSQRPYISSLKSTFEGSNNERQQRPEVPKGSDTPTKPSRLGGTKVSTIANMFQSLTPTKEDIYHARPGFAKPESPKTEHAKKSPSQQDEAPVEELPRNERKGSTQDLAPRDPNTPVVHLNRTESHLARFNTARAMFERLEEQSMRTKGGISPTSKKRSGSVSPSRAVFSPSRLSRSPSPGETQSVGSSPKRESPLSPRDKSRSADSILGERNRENAATFYHTSQLNGRRHELELDLHECGAGEAIISPGPFSPEFASYLPPSPLEDTPRTNGRCLDDSKAKAKPAPLSPKPTDVSNLSPRGTPVRRRELPKPEASPSSSPKASPKHQNASRGGATSQRPRVVSTTPSTARSRMAEERSKSHIPQLQKDAAGGIAARRAAARSASPIILEGSTVSTKSENAPTLVSAVEKRQDVSPIPSPTSSTTNGTIHDRMVPNGSSKDSGKISTIAASSTPHQFQHSRTVGSSVSPRQGVGQTVTTECIQEQDQSILHSGSVPSGDYPTPNSTIGGSGSCAAVFSAENHIPHADPATLRLRDSQSSSDSGSQTLVLSTDGMPYSDTLPLKDTPGVIDTSPTSSMSPLDPATGGRPIGSLQGLEEDEDVTTVELVSGSTASDAKTTVGITPDLPDLNQQWDEAIEQLAPETSKLLEANILLETSVQSPEQNPTVVVNSQGTSPLSPPWQERTVPQEVKATSQVNGDLPHEERLIGHPDAASNGRGTNEEPEIMTPEEADQLLSSPEILSDEEATEVKKMLLENKKIVTGGAESESHIVVNKNYEKQQPGFVDDYASQIEANPEEEEDEAEEEYEEDAADYQGPEEGVHYLEDGHFWVEVPGLPESDEDDVIDTYQCITMPKKRVRVKFSVQPIRVYSTFSVMDYDRRNDDVDPVSASAEYELEKRVEKMEVFPVELLKGPEGLGLSIIGMGVGADAGLEKLGIFVKTITEGGAAHKDGCIRVNDQIIEVDGKSLVGVTQAYAASVLRNTSGLVRFLIGREKDGENSEVAQLISQSLQADRERDERRKALEQELQNQRQHNEGESRSDSYPGLTLPIPSLAVQPPCSPQNMVQEDSTPEEGEDGPTCEVFDLEEDSSESPSPDSDVTTLRIKLKETQYKNAVADAEIAKSKSKVAMLEALQSEHQEYEKRLQLLTIRLAETEKVAETTRKEVMTYQDMLEESQGQYILLEKKYYKAKKLIKEFQQRQQDLFHREEYHIQQLQEKDQEYNALVKALKDRVIQLEQDLMETQKAAGLPVKLPYDNTSIKQLQLTPQPLRKPHVLNQKRRSSNGLEIDISDSELSDGDFAKYDISPDSDEAEKKTSTVERKPPSKDDVFEKAVPQTELLDSTAAKAKAELASKGSLANRQPPSIKKTGSTGSSGDGTSLDLKDSDSSTSIGSSREDLDESAEPSLGDKISTSTSLSSDTSPVSTPLPSLDGASISHRVTQLDFSYNTESSNVVEHQHKSMGRLQQSVITMQQQRQRSVNSSSPEVRTTAVKIDDRFAEEMRIILERKNMEAKRQIASEEIDQFGVPVEKSYGHPQPAVSSLDVPLNLTSSPGSTVSSQSTCSNATAGSDQGAGLVSKRALDAGLPYSAKRGSSSGCARFCPQSEPTPRGPPLSCCCLPGAAQTADSTSMERSSYPVGIDIEGGSIISAKTQQPQSVLGDHGIGGGVIPGGVPDRRAHQWLSCSVLDWSTAQVGQWLLALSMEQYISAFLDNNINGQELIFMDGTKLKTLGVVNSNDRSALKKKIKELRAQVEKERKAAEKEVRAREKLLRKAEKAAEKAGKRK